MTPRRTALAVAIVAIVVVVLQDVRPGLDFYHTWQYAAALAIAIVVSAAYALDARRGGDGPAGGRLALAMAGALVVAGAGLLAGLIGPDTITVGGSPGSVTPVPDLGAAAFFGQADAQTIARGDGTVMLRKKDAAAIPVPPHGKVYLGTSIAYLGTKPAAYIVARDARGNHLTVTQPNAASTFLSPVLLFPNTQPIKDKTYPLDTFAVPALHRIARALYFTADDAATFNHLGTHVPALVLSVNEDNGKTVGLTIAPSGREVSVGGVKIVATLGSYPVLMVASAPHPAVLIGGILLFLGAVLAAFSTERRLRIESARISPTA
ncbi:MAG: hypothetical protein NVSMB64_11940 [Candidatus Velthaea sp.]